MAVWIVSGGPAGAAVDYLRDIKPVLQERCQACHGALKQNAGLRVDTAAQMLAGGKAGPVVISGQPDKSPLMARLTSTDPHERMPLEAAPLKPEQIAAIREWIASGAPVPAGEKGEADPRDHWSFQPVRRPAVPEGGGAVNPIDAFLGAKHAAHGLKAQPEAERGLLLRRLYLDLLGFPPSAGQLSDPRPYEEIVDELLQSPHHGERWARHWMDVWRYADWYGLGTQLRHSQKHLWHWRDWIVESLNADKGYDRMIQEMLAGDELAPGDASVVRATGYLARSYYLFNRTTWLDDTIEHTGKAFLGLTLNCAKCHDHKYDPIDMADYYNFRALFEPHQVRLDPVPGVTDFEKGGIPRVFDNHPEAPTQLHLRGDPAKPDPAVKIVPAVPALFAGFAPPIEPVALPASEWAPASREYVQRDHLAAARAKVESARRERDTAVAALATAGKPDEKAKPAAAGAGSVWLRDEFDRADPEKWELVGEGWSYEGGKLIQSRASRDRAMLRSRQPHPHDFDLTCRYTTTGGTTYKSVTFRFDLSEDGKQAHFVYTSAYEPGPKVQVAHTVDGKDDYPGGAAAARPIRVGETHELRFAVRDRLVNVWLDGELVIVHALPRRIDGGRIALSGFDATVAFDSIEIRELAPDVSLTEAKPAAPSAQPAAPADPAKAARLAEARLAVAEAEQSHLEAVIAADTAALKGRDESLDRVASQREGAMLKARALLDVATHEASGDAEKLKAAREAVAVAEKKLAAKDTSYTALRGARKALETPEHNDNTYPATYPATSTGRRLMLARWITARDNPLTARVAVNQVWMRHFGEPLVETVFDFGRQAPRPEHHELLDWLAAEFMEAGWSFRHLHRLIVTSAAYRRSSTNAGADPATLAADPINRHYWRAFPRRMESQAVRDSLLSLAGALDPAVGGPAIDPRAPSVRRGLYFVHSRDDEDKFLSMFDNADILQCYRRSESIVPQHALAMANSAISMEMAGRIASRLHAAHPSPDRGAFIDAVFSELLGRAPDDAERAACEDYWTEMGALDSIRSAADPDGTVRARLVHALLNHNDFVTIR
ncbi:MAG: DUF1553 domain-containing protein [Verrucomicrobiales bacterium]|nr:DUF1553 domain-containing protein [Verrucomicrobiales bacterium]